MAKKMAPKTNGGSTVTSGDKKPTGSRNVNRRVSQSPTFVSLYANDVEVQTSPWDVRFTFGEMSAEVSGETTILNVRQVGEVRLSPPLAKRMLSILLKQVNTYEEKFGPIPQPKD